MRKHWITTAIVFLIIIIFLIVGWAEYFHRNNSLVSQKPWPDLPMQYNNGEYYRITYKSDGLDVVGILAKPNGDGPFPTVIYNRGGNREYGKIQLPVKLIYLLVNNGYMVLASQYRGNDGGEGKEQFGGDDVHDVLNLITVAQTLNYCDPNNLFMVGCSRGGMMTYLVLKEQVPIRGAVIINGVSNIFEQVIHDPEWEEYVLEQLIPGLSENKEEEYKKRSALFWADKINIPILIQHSIHDERVPYETAVVMAQKLKDLGKDVSFISYNATHRPTEEMVNDMIKWLKNERCNES